jgi:hypothetical protein
MINNELLKQGANTPGEEPPKPHIIIPPKKVNRQKFEAVIKEHLDSYSALEEK